MGINQLESAWNQLMKNLGPACCEGCRHDEPINENGEHYIMDITWPCKTVILRKYLETVKPNNTK